MDRLLLSVAAAPFVFVGCAFATRAPARATDGRSYPSVGESGHGPVLFGVLRDWRVARAADSVIVFGSGVSPWLADAAAWLLLMALALGIQLTLGGPARSLR